MDMERESEWFSTGSKGWVRSVLGEALNVQALPATTGRAAWPCTSQWRYWPGKGRATLPVFCSSCLGRIADELPERRKDLEVVQRKDLGALRELCPTT